MWEAIGAIGEAFGAIALFLVLAQVRHAREEVRRSVSQGRLDAARQLATQHADNGRLNTTLYFKAFVALDGAPSPFTSALLEKTGMTSEEASTLGWNQSAWWLFSAQVIAQVDHLPADERTEFDDATRVNCRNNPLASLWYAHARATLPNRAAVAYVDSLLAQPQ